MPHRSQRDPRTRRPVRTTPAPPALVLALALAVAAAGCVGGLDTGPLETRIEADLESQAAGIDIERVECPDDVEPQAGRVFVCRAFAVDGSVGTVEVQQVDDQGAVEWELTDVSAPGATEGSGAGGDGGG